jgi:hypothetical protein
MVVPLESTMVAGLPDWKLTRDACSKEAVIKLIAMVNIYFMIYVRVLVSIERIN